jgi:2-keto-4-pentenoate hydratase/2-oxohepta-3-ene-1,7-dioic acid hydratase in catechol pathway
MARPCFAFLNQNRIGESAVRIVTYQWGGRRYVGRLSADGKDVTPLRFDGEWRERAQRGGALALIEMMAEGHPRPQADGVSLPLSALTLEAPLPHPRRNIFCVGKNYYEHAREFGGSGFDPSSTKPGDEIPEVPYVFTKVPESVIAPRAAVRIPEGVSEAIDYEAELAVVIGKGGVRIPKSSAMDHVWGYTIVNDVTARDWQHRHRQWHMGKSFDTFCPMGPQLVSREELNGQNTRIRTWINGEPRQDANTKDLIFDIPTLIECISAGITLYPGDIIATGTPAGVGIGFKPPKYLKSGDVMRIEIDGIGVLENPVF